MKNPEISHTPSERHEGAYSTKPTAWEKMASEVPPFNPDQKVNDQTPEYDYDAIWQQTVDELRRARSAERQAKLRKTVNVEALLSESDEELAKWARRVDNSTFAIPGQEDAADRRFAEAVAGYKRASEFRDAEREVLEDIQDYDRTRYSQDELIDRLRERQFDIRREKQDGGLENWLQQSQACDRLIHRLEKFYPETADQLDDNDMAYWQKITGSAKQVPAEDLLPKTLPRADLFQLIGNSSTANKAKQRMTSRYSAFKQQVPNVETNPSDIASDDAKTVIEESLEPTSKTDEQIAAERKAKRRAEDEAFKKRLEEYNRQKAEEQRRRQQNEEKTSRREANQAERQRTIADAREKVIDTYRQENKQPTSYHFEASLAGKEATITVGQEIPDDWFEPKVAGSKLKSGFGVFSEQPPLVENYLQQALNVEFSKLSESERQQYDYAKLFQQIKEEAKRTKRMPDIAAIIKENEQEMTT